MTPDALAILAQGREATLASLRPDGWPQATIVNYVNDRQHLYFDCGASSQKAINIAADDRVSLAVLVPYFTFGPILGLSLSGHAKRIEAQADLLHVLYLWKVRYPHMRERLARDLHEFAFYAVAPTVVTMADYAAGLGHMR
jgi:hypothetical protein